MSEMWKRRPCGTRRGVLCCDKEKGHEGRHADAHVLRGWTEFDAVSQPTDGASRG